MADALFSRHVFRIVFSSQSPGTATPRLVATSPSPVPKALSLVDQLGLWGNLGVSLLGFTGAIFVLQPNGTGTPELSMLAGLSGRRWLSGHCLEPCHVALGGRCSDSGTGAPAMVLLRGLFGARLSYLPTVLNILQCVGWGIFELVTIATAAHRVAPALPKWWAYVTYRRCCYGGTRRAAPRFHPHAPPLRNDGAVVVLAVPLSSSLLRHPVARFDTRHLVGFLGGDRQGRWPRRSRSSPWRLTTHDLRTDRATFGSTLVGYSITQILCYVIGLLALVTVSRNPNDIYGAFIAVPAGTIGFGTRRPVSSTSHSPTSTRRPFRLRTCGRCGTAGCLRSRSPPWRRPALFLEHRRLRELPRPHRIGVRAHVSRPRNRFLHPLEGTVGSLRRGRGRVGRCSCRGRRVSSCTSSSTPATSPGGCLPGARSPVPSASRQQAGCPRRSCRSVSPAR